MSTLSELDINDYGGVVVDGQLSEDSGNNTVLGKNCPICGSPLQLRKDRNLGFGIWLCTNEPELCSFMTNNPGAGDLQIVKCDQCSDGYLIVRNKKGEFFLGCTNYKTDGSGCTNTVNGKQFIDWSRTADWNKIESDPAYEDQEEHKGFCIRCGKEIEFSSELDDPYPYCLSCYRQWTSEGRDEEKKENFCHYCGKKAARFSFRKPVEYECWKILK